MLLFYCARNLGGILGRTIFVFEDAVPELEGSALKSFVVICNDRQHLVSIHLAWQQTHRQKRYFP
jgi:hypothetical protein